MKLLGVTDNDVDIYNYTDDNYLICSGYEYELIKTKVLHKVHKVTSWFESNHIDDCFVFGKSNNLGKFHIGNNDIVPDDKYKNIRTDCE